MITMNYIYYKCDYVEPYFINDFINKLLTYNERYNNEIELLGVFSNDNLFIHEQHLLTNGFKHIESIFQNAPIKDKRKFLQIIDYVYLILEIYSFNENLVEFEEVLIEYYIKLLEKTQ